MKAFNWNFIIGLSLIALSAVLYFAHYLIFRDVHHIFLYFIGDTAFLPIEVLLVTLVLHRALSVREKKIMLKKLNMVIGVFFSEVGMALLKCLSMSDPRAKEIRKNIMIHSDWTEREFFKAGEQLQEYEYKIIMEVETLEKLRGFLLEKRNFMLRLLENPSLLEHESFTELLWAVFHLTEELVSRTSLRNLPDPDYQHLYDDISRTYNLLVSEWLRYMKHLQIDYPYLFSFAVRTNPFNPGSSPVIEK